MHAKAGTRITAAEPVSALKKSLLLHAGVLGLIVLLPYLHTPPTSTPPAIVQAVLLAPASVPAPQARPAPTPEVKPRPEAKPVSAAKPAVKPPAKPLAGPAAASKPVSVAKQIPLKPLAEASPAPRKATAEKPDAHEKKSANTSPARPLLKPAALNRHALDDEITRLQQELAQSEQARLNAQAAQKAQAAQASADQALRDKYQRQINQRVVSKWNRPLNARNGMITILRITVLPGGEVQSVITLKSSGDAAFDASAEEAVRRSSPLPVPSDSVVFNRYFRVITLNFNPEDL